jgi:sugar porter (SP) family MFS transporter
MGRSLKAGYILFILGKKDFNIMKSRNYLLAAFAGLLFGFDTGVIAGAMVFIKQSFGITATFEGLITGAVPTGAILGALLGMIIADRLGRRPALLISAVLFLLGTLLATFASSVMMLVFARLLLGVAIGISSMNAPVYLAELAEARLRGRLTTLFQLCITLGILLAYICNYLLAPSWRLMFFMGIIPALLLFFGILFGPETPRWLYAKGHIDKAREVLRSVRQEESIEHELSDIAASVVLPRRAKISTWKQALSGVIMIGILLAVFQQVTGINAVLYYAPSIFSLAGFAEASGQLLNTIGIGVINVLATILAFYLIDRVGRRPLLLVGLFGMTVTLFLLVYFFTKGSVGIVMAMTLLAYVAFFAIGLGPGFWLLAAEIFPLHIRALGMGIATMSNWLANALVTTTFPILRDHLGANGTLAIFAFFAVLAFFFVFWRIPETKDKSLEDIERYWIAKGKINA